MAIMQPPMGPIEVSIASARRSCFIPVAGDPLWDTSGAQGRLLSTLRAGLASSSANWSGNARAKAATGA
jgi:hypothetical protein